MYVPMTLLVLLCLLAAVPVAMLWAAVDKELKPYGLCLLGARERWRDDSTADRTWSILYIPVFRQRWTHSTAML